ncbi:MAG: oligosaccharide flippase family protein [Desulfobacterales bacterium]|nr:oligosaccharide flippase family protein [Desulfobacterales bacterium]
MYKIFWARVGGVSILNITDQLLQVGFIVMLSRTCTLELMGTYLTLTVTWTLGEMAVDFGLNPILIKESAKQGILPLVLANVQFVKGLSWAIVSCIGILFFCLFKPVAIYVIVSTIVIVGLRSMMNSLSALMAGQNKAEKVSLCLMIMRMTTVIPTWFVLTFYHSIFCVILIHFIGTLVIIYTLWNELGIQRLSHFFKFERVGCYNVLKESAAVGLAWTGTYLLFYQPLFWLKIINSKQAALYGVAVRGLEFLLIPANALLVILLPYLSSHSNQNTRSILIRHIHYGILALLILDMFIFQWFPDLTLFTYISVKLSPFNTEIKYLLLGASLIGILQVFHLILFTEKLLTHALPYLLVSNTMIFSLFSFALNHSDRFDLSISLKLLSVQTALTILMTLLVKQKSQVLQ